MDRLKKVTALLLVIVMCIHAVPVPAAAKKAREAEDEVRFNTGSYEYRMTHKKNMDAMLESFTDKYGASVMEPEKYQGNWEAEEEADELRHYAVYDELNGDYEIVVEENAFFPYEVQFSYGGKTFCEWFMENGDSVTVGGHNFRVTSYADGKAITKMSIKVGGDTVRLYPEEKVFTNDENSLIQGASLLPLKEMRLSVPRQNYTPIELTRVTLEDVFQGETKLPKSTSIMWRKWSGYTLMNDYKAGSLQDVFDLFDRSLEVFIGESDQLAADSIRYIVQPVSESFRSDWLQSNVYMDNNDKTEITSKCGYSEYKHLGDGEKSISVNFTAPKKGGTYFLTLSLNPDCFEIDKLMFSELKVFEGKCTEDTLGTEITEKIWENSKNGSGSGYMIEPEVSANHWITLVSYKDGTVTGCLPLELWVFDEFFSGIERKELMKDTEDGDVQVNYSLYTHWNEDVLECTYRLFDDPLDGKYKLSFDYYKKDDGQLDNNSDEFYAYRGIYDSIKAAQNAGAEDVKKTLFGDGYQDDYSGDGIGFSIFIGEDGDAEQEKYYYKFKTDRYIESEDLNSNTYVFFSSIETKDGTDVPFYKLYPQDHDSYDGQNYTFFVSNKAGRPEQDVDLSALVVRYRLADGAKMYVNGELEDSQKSRPIDFSSKTVQFTVASEDGMNQTNYFVRAFKAGTQADGHPAELYITSLDHDKSQTKRGEIVESTRELFLDSYHNDLHDILIANVGYTSMSALRAELKSDSIVMDDYWKLNGRYDLAGFTTIERTESIGLLPNLAKVRLKAKEGDLAPKDYGDLGTLTFTAQEASGQKTKMVLKLTGVVGDPRMTMTKIKNPTKYVPYGIMITNSNTYEWNSPRYEMESGRLPKGMKLLPNGELYGVPMETGTFDITIKMNNSGKLKPDTRSFRFEVLDNSDENVANAEDNGYELKKKISGINDTTDSGDYLIESKGVFDEFVDLYIDGVKLKLHDDYEAESGSTRITIISKSLPKSEGVHTIGVEFRKNKNQRVVNAAAQNYKVEKKNTDPKPRPNPTPTPIGGGGSYGSGGSGGGQSVSPSPKPTPDPTPDPGPTPDPTPDPNPEPSPEPAPVRKDLANASKYTVKAGDTLKSIAKKFYGRSGKWKKIYDANKDVIPESKKLKKGMTLQIPALNYTVKEGDDIKSIAKKYFGAASKWKLIYRINKDVIPSSRQLEAGTRLVLPVPVVCAVYTVKKEDNLGKIALKYYGKENRWRKIFQANRDKIYKSYRMKVGSQLYIPAMTCTAKKDDDLKSLSKKYYGTKSKWRQIYNANKDVIPKSKKIKAGVTLVIPVPVDISQA